MGWPRLTHIPVRKQMLQVSAYVQQQLNQRLWHPQPTGDLIWLFDRLSRLSSTFDFVPFLIWPDWAGEGGQGWFSVRFPSRDWHDMCRRENKVQSSLRAVTRACCLDGSLAMDSLNRCKEFLWISSITDVDLLTKGSLTKVWYCFSAILRSLLMLWITVSSTSKSPLSSSNGPPWLLKTFTRAWTSSANVTWVV